MDRRARGHVSMRPWTAAREPSPTGSHGTLNDAAPAAAAVKPAHERMTAFVKILVADPGGVDMLM